MRRIITSSSDEARLAFGYHRNWGLGFNTMGAETQVYSEAPSLQDWHHMAVSKENGTTNLFIDGVLLDSDTTSDPIYLPSAITIGARFKEDYHHFWDGYISQVHVTFRAKYTSNFIPTMIAPDSDTIGLWDFSTGSGLTLIDQSGNEHHGTIHGATWVNTCPEEDWDGDGIGVWEDCDDNNSSIVNTNVDDADCDLSNSSEDCDDNDPTIYPYAGDTYGDGIDSDCDGTDLCNSEYFNETYFSACYDPMTWQNARSTCQIRGYDDLVTITDSSENIFVHNLFPVHELSDGGVYWFGYNDINNVNNFTWASGISATYSNWNSGEPNGGSIEDCGMLYSNAFIQYTLWNDHPCSNAHSYVCEKR